MSQVVVPGRGPIPASWMIIGEAPGKAEAADRKPFVGPSGRAQETYLNRHGVTTLTARLDNVVGLYQPGNPDPTPELIAEWTPRRLADIRKVAPKLCVAVGRFAARWFLGEEADLDLVWGVPLPAGIFDSSRADRACGAAVVCIYHPAYALHAKNDDDAVRALTLVAAGYERVARCVKDIEAGRPIEVRRDLYAGREQYRDVTGKQLADALHKAGKGTVIGFDTEGTPSNPWSLQCSLKPGTGMVLRPAQRDFRVGVKALQQAADKGAIFSTHSFSTPEHGCAYEILMARSMGLRLDRVWDTMAAAYLLRLEPQGAKDLAFRWCGMRMASFMDTVGDAAREKQVDWLCEVLKHDWPKPEPRVEVDNGGVAKLKTPKPIATRVEAMLIAVYANNDDPHRRWDMMDSELKRQVEQKLGVMPGVSLDDIPLSRAVFYSARDSDWQWRGYHALHAELDRLNLLGKMDQLMGVLPIFESCQAGGMPISRARLEALEYRLSTEMDKLRSKMSKQFCGGRVFNPNSSRHVVSLMIRRGLEGARRTKKGAPSISKQSVEHLRYVDEAMAMRTDWNEKRHNKNTYVDKLLDMVPEGVDRYTLRCNIKPNATTTSRIAAVDPALLAFPKHEKPGGTYGKWLRECFVCEPGEVFAEWDYSQAEVRMLAHESEDSLLCRLLTEIDKETGKPRDVHTETAARIFGVNIADVNKNQRFLAKSTTFGIFYGISGMGLSTQMRMKIPEGSAGWDEDTCNRLIHEWLKLYSGAANYFVAVERDLLKTGWVRDCWQMPRFLPAAWSDERKLASEARRQAVNHRIQGGAQGMTQNAMIALAPKIKAMQARGVNVRWALQIHDSLLMIMDEGVFEKVDKVMTKTMVEECGIRLRVPVVVDSHAATTWGEL